MAEANISRAHKTKLIVNPGDRRGHLIVIREVKKKRVSSSRWDRAVVCRCDCGTELEVAIANFLYNPRQQGCRRCGIRASSENRTRHGATRGGYITSEYRIWACMLNRCENPENRSYHRYGGRGITVCDRWRGREGFNHFLLDMGPRPQRKTLDRINNDGGYNKDNCRWATFLEQGANLSTTVRIEVQPGVFQSASHFARQHGFFREHVILLHEQGYTATQTKEMISTYKKVRGLLREYAKRYRIKRPKRVG